MVALFVRKFYAVRLVNMAADAFDQTSVNVHVVFLRLTVDPPAILHVGMAEFVLEQTNVVVQKASRGTNVYKPCVDSHVWTVVFAMSLTNVHVITDGTERVARRSDVCLTVKMVVPVLDGTAACVLRVIQDIIVNLEWWKVVNCRRKNAVGNRNGEEMCENHRSELTWWIPCLQRKSFIVQPNLYFSLKCWNSPSMIGVSKRGFPVSPNATTCWISPLQHLSL